MRREILRIFGRRSEIYLCCAIGLGPLTFACSSSAQTATPRFAIEPSQVSDAMREARLPVEGIQVKLAAPVTSSVTAAQVEVQSVSPIRPHQVRLRMACIDHSECLPFFAVATFPESMDVTTLHSGQDQKVAADLRRKVQSLVTGGDGDRTAKVAIAKGADTLRAGTKATLEFEADRIHVRIEVISLQSGVPGSRVRVSSIDRKQVYTAEVVTPTLLKGEIAE